MNLRYLLPILLLSSCENPEPKDVSKQEETQTWFVNEAEERGVDLTWVSGATGEFHMPEIIGGGGAFIDFDNDGDLDIYFVQGGSFKSNDSFSNILLRNDDGQFVDVTESSGTSDFGYGMGIATGDYDNDGFVDIYVTNVGKNTLLHNNGDGTFTNVTDQAGVGDDGWGASVAFVDLDGDGDLEIYATNYLMWEEGLVIDCFNAKGTRDYCSPINYMAPSRDVLYENLGDGTFRDVSSESGLGVRVGTGLGVVCNDFTGDGLTDIFVANDGMPDQLWQNKGNLRFIDVASLRGCALDNEGKAKAGMGVISEDFDNDGDFDIVVCNLTGESDSLFRNDGDYFTDVTSRKGIRTTTRHATRFGLGWVDFNNDGILDLFEANGRVQQIGTPHTDDPFAEQNYLLQGTTQGWNKISAIKNSGTHTSRGAMFGDVDNDGGVDILVINKDAKAYLLMNAHANRSKSVILEVLNESGSPALGARVTARRGETELLKSVQSAWSILAANDPRVHFGLGNEEQLDNVTVHWVDGTTTKYGTLQKGFHTLQRSNTE